MPKDRIKTAVIGIGSWGKQIALELNTISNLSAYVSLGSELNTSWALEHLPDVHPSTLEKLCADTSIKAVAIATPIKTHARISEQLLKTKKHIFIEKPTAETSQEARLLAEKAAHGSLLLVTGYIFLYSSVYRELKRHIGEIGVKKVVCTWRKYGTFIEPIEFNLLTHHLSIALDLLGEPLTITTLRHTSLDDTVCNKIDTTLVYGVSTFISSIDRTSKDKSHTIEVFLNDGTSFLWDDSILFKRQADHANYVRIYENGEKPLTLELQSFVEAVQGKNTYLPSSGVFGAQVLQLLERITTMT
mgnify:CR=1 FL=1